MNSAAADRGRGIYCRDLARGEVIAALSYHVDADRTRPILLTAIALREDVERDPTLYAESLAAALVLKEYLHVVGWKDGRGSQIEHQVPAGSPALEAYRRALGFVVGGHPKGSRTAGQYLRQPPVIEAPSD